MSCGMERVARGRAGAAIMTRDLETWPYLGHVCTDAGSMRGDLQSRHCRVASDETEMYRGAADGAAPLLR